MHYYQNLFAVYYNLKGVLIFRIVYACFYYLEKLIGINIFSSSFVPGFQKVLIIHNGNTVLEEKDRVTIFGIPESLNKIKGMFVE